jgi:serine/threonine protein kinase
VDDYAGRVLAHRYRLPRPPADEYELVESRAFDTYSGQEVLVRQVLLPEVVGAEPEYGTAADDTSSSDSAERAMEAARAAAAIPDHPRLVQVFDIFTDGGSLWIVSELVPARPLAALLADERLSPHRAAEVGSDVLTALRAVHAHRWTHRNVTAGTVLVCDDGRAMLTGLAVSAAQEALCGYNPVPVPALAGGGDAEGENEGGHGWGGPDSLLELERARQARITVVGPVTERWAPEQATQTQENWQLAPPVGPEADLWALGSLLFRSVQGHPPFPEENATELVQLVCAERPALAEECGPLRPIVESLLRQDPAERPDVEELRGRLRSLIRSAPEPELGLNTVQVPTDDPHRLPIVRRRGEMVRERKASPEPVPEPSAHGRHKRARQQQQQQRGSRRLGVMMLGLVLLLLAAVVLYAALFMPRTTTNSGSSVGTLRTQVTGAGANDGKSQPHSSSSTPTTAQHSALPSSSPSPNTTGLGADFKVTTDPSGFTIGVPTGWQRQSQNANGQIRYTGGGYQLIVVPGRDSVAAAGSDPLAYQSATEPELDAFRASNWSSVFGARTLDVNGNSAAEGEYSWRDQGGTEVYARNLAMIVNGRYHVIMVIGPSGQSPSVKRYFDTAVATYRTT